MIRPDANVLVYAFHRDSPRHDRYADWLSDVVGGAAKLALADVVLTGLVRIVTGRRIFSDPAPTVDVLDFVDSLRTAARVRMLPSTDASWARMRDIAIADPQVRANLVPDAWLAALALAHGCRLATADRGFARFAGLDWFDPAADEPAREVATHRAL